MHNEICSTQRINIFILLIVALSVSSCSVRQVITVDAPLSKTLDGVKRELSAFKYALAADAKLKKDEKKYFFSCAGQGIDAIGAMEIKDIVVTVSVANTVKTEGGGGIAVKAVSFDGGGSKEKKDTNSLSLKVKPQDIAADRKMDFANRAKDGIADSLLAVVEQFAKTNESTPCLQGAESTLTLGFDLTKSSKVEGGVDLVVLNIGAGRTDKKTFSNNIAVKFDFNGAISE